MIIVLCAGIIMFMTILFIGICDDHIDNKICSQFYNNIVIMADTQHPP